MVCPTCNGEIPDTHSACPLCAAQIRTAASAPGETPQASDAQQIIPSNQVEGWSQIVFWLFSVIFSFCVLLFNFFIARHRYETFSAEALGYMIGGSIAPFLLGLLVAYLARKSAHRPKYLSRRIFAICSIAFLFSLLNFATSNPLDATDRATLFTLRIGNLFKDSLRNGSSDKPASSAEELGRDFLLDATNWNKQYAKETAALRDPTLKPLYSPSSFATHDQMQQTLVYLQRKLVVEQKYTNIEPLIDKMKAHARSSSLTRVDQDAYIQGVLQGMQKPLAANKVILEKEIKWIDASIDLYQFTLAEENNFSLKDNKLIFRNGASAQFKEKQSIAIQLRNELQQERNNALKERKDALAQFGLTPSDVGVPSNSVQKAK